MDKVINSYETLFIVNCENGEEAVKATVDKFTGLVAENGTVESVNEWGNADSLTRSTIFPKATMLL
jgi:small subunit ribosomal protein S6